MLLTTELSRQRDHVVECALFLLVAVICLHDGWLVHSANPYEFIRQGDDHLGYYQWLPAVFIDHDVHKMYWTYDMQDGRWLSLFTIGVAVLQLPFFLIGHLWAQVFDYPLNGFSSPYALAQIVGAAIYAGAGCVLAYRLASRFSSAESALLAVVSLFAASNLFYYAVYEPMMSHVYSFFLIALFALCTVRLLDPPERPGSVVYATLFVVSGSLLLLVRQLNVIVFLFPLILAWRSPGGVKGLVRRALAHRNSVIIAASISLVPWALQMWYWHHITGELIIYTYGKKGETFHFASMMPRAVMTNVRNGWLVLTPLMLPLVVTLIIKTWRGTAPARTITLILTLSWMLYSAWWCWWLGKSYSYRAFVDLYALLAIPLAWMFQRIMRSAWSWRLVTALAMVTLIKLNFGLMERFTWEWSFESWNWSRFFEQVSAVFTA